MESGTCGGVPADELEAEVLFGIVEPVAQDQRDVEGDPARLVAVDVGAVDEDEAAVLAGAGGADLVEGHDGIASAGRRVVDEEAQLGRQDRRRPRHLWQVEPETAVAVVVPDAVQVSSWKKTKKNNRSINRHLIWVIRDERQGKPIYWMEILVLKICQQVAVALSGVVEKRISARFESETHSFQWSVTVDVFVSFSLFAVITCSQPFGHKPS